MTPREFIRSDLHRYYGGRLTFRDRLFMPLEVKYMIVYRKAQYSTNRLVRTYYKLWLRRLSIRTQIQIQTSTKIGKGFFIGHLGRIIISDKAVLGENVNISTGVTIGKTNRGTKKGTPTIGNKVWIGTNAVIVGNVQIGDNVLIAPNAYVNFDVPSDSVVIGNPGVIHPNQNATSGYINNTI